MKIVLNFIGSRVGGGRTDALNLLEAIPANAPKHEFLALVPDNYGYDKIVVSSNCHVHYEPIHLFNDLWRIYFDNIIIDKICKQYKADVLFTVCNTGPIKIDCCKHILMLRRPQLFYNLDNFPEYSFKEKSKYWFLRWYFQKSARFADHIIVQTETIKELLYETYKVYCPVTAVGKNVTVNYRTIEDSNKSSKQVLKLLDTHAKFKLLYLTKYYAHKNIEKVCDAMAYLRKSGIDVVLFLTIEKNDHPNARLLINRLEHGDYKNAVTTLGRVDLADINHIYYHCDAVLMPSLLESFSATYLEAMAFNRPLLVSDRKFAHEICGEAAIYFDPLSTSSIAETIKRIVDNEKLRKSLVEKGIAQYRKYDISWDEIAKQYLNIILI